MTAMQTSRRAFLKRMALAGGAALLAPVGLSRALAEETEKGPLAGRRIRWIVPTRPGGGYDIYARLIQPFLEKRLGASIVIENIGGGGTVIGSNTLRDSKPDGTTLGIIGATGLLVARLLGETDTPHPVHDYTLLGRVSRNQPIWVTGAQSPIKSIDDVLARGRVVFAITDVTTATFVNIAVASELLGIGDRVDMVAGFVGSRATSLSAIRGEVDLVTYSFESLCDRIVAGELRPILQIADKPLSEHPVLEGVPLLGGEDGVAARVAKAANGDVARAIADARALEHLVTAGRLIAAPRGLEPGLAAYLQEQVHAALADAAFAEAAVDANRSLDVAPPATVIAELEEATRRSETFLPILEKALRKARE